MKKTIATLFILLAAIIPGFTKTPPAQDSLETKTILYKVTHPDHAYVSYLFGTHHAFGKPFFDSLQAATDALLSSQVLIKENLNIPGHLAEDLINQRTTNTKWKKYLDKDGQSYVRGLFSAGTLDFDKMSPAELYAFLSRHYKEQICIEKEANADYFSLDDYIGNVAEENQIPLIGLETTEEQIRLINEDLKGMPAKIHKRRLASMIHRLRTESRDLCAEIEWYRKMDFDFKLNQPCQNALILEDRNENWMVQIRGLFASKNCFVAVGLSHLMFECGLINKLREQGYQIVPVPVR
jgi:uncharacterized protein YbaP (TraB family)